MNPYLSDKRADIEKEKKEYAAQVNFVNSQTLDVINHIKEVSNIQPIIIIQGDHGWTVNEKTEDKYYSMKERMAILNAYLVPEDIHRKLYNNITPVNSFRLVLSWISGIDIPLLSDRNYFYDSEQLDSKKSLVDVTDILLL